MIEGRPRQQWIKMGFRQGDPVEFHRFPQEDIRVENDNSFRWGDQVMSATAVRAALRAKYKRPEGNFTIDGRDPGAAFDALFGPKAPRVSSLPNVRPHGEVTVRSIVRDPGRLMGVKAVWGTIREPVMGFGARGDASVKDGQYFQEARRTAELAVGSPYLITIGGGEKVPGEFRGRVLELVRVTRAYGETSTFVADATAREELAQWPIAVVLSEVFEIQEHPRLVEDLGFADRRILSSAFDRVKQATTDIAALWAALAEWPVVRREVPTLPGLLDPEEAYLCLDGYPKIGRTEGKRRAAEARKCERNGTLRRDAKLRNRDGNGGVFACVACGWADLKPGMFDAHHLFPLHIGERESNIDDLAVLCPTCHRWAHKYGIGPAEPLDLRTLTLQRGNVGGQSDFRGAAVDDERSRNDPRGDEAPGSPQGPRRSLA